MLDQDLGLQTRVIRGAGVASKPFEDMVGVQTAAVMMLVLVGAGAQLSDDLSREQLKPLTAFRQQHRRLVCGPLPGAQAPRRAVAQHFPGRWTAVRSGLCAGLDRPCRGSLSSSLRVYKRLRHC